MTDEPSVPHEQAITLVLMSNSNAPAALTQSFGGRIDLSQSHGDAEIHEMRSELQLWIARFTCIKTLAGGCWRRFTK